MHASSQRLTFPRGGVLLNRQYEFVHARPIDTPLVERALAQLGQVLEYHPDSAILLDGVPLAC